MEALACITSLALYSTLTKKPKDLWSSRTYFLTWHWRVLTEWEEQSIMIFEKRFEHCQFEPCQYDLWSGVEFILLRGIADHLHFQLRSDNPSTYHDTEKMVCDYRSQRNLNFLSEGASLFFVNATLDSGNRGCRGVKGFSAIFLCQSRFGHDRYQRHWSA